MDCQAATRTLPAGCLGTEDDGTNSPPGEGSQGTCTSLPPGTRAATLRPAVPMRDFASFVGRHEDLRHYADLPTETLDADGAPTLQWQAAGPAPVLTPPRRWRAPAPPRARRRTPPRR